MLEAAVLLIKEIAFAIVCPISFKGTVYQICKGDIWIKHISIELQINEGMIHKIKPSALK